jgi:hypothetical protein
MTDMDSKQDAFFDQAYKLARAIDSMTAVMSALGCIERNGEVVRNLDVNGQSVDVMCLPGPDAFIEMLHAMINGVERSREDVANMLTQYVRAGSSTGVIDNDFAAEFIDNINDKIKKNYEA